MSDVSEDESDVSARRLFRLPKCIRDVSPPPMHAETYRQILIKAGRLSPTDGRTSSEVEDGEGLGEDDGDPDDFTEVELLLRQDLSQNKAVWVGSFWEDLWYFSININPVISMCYSHPLHPISRTERFIVYGFSFVFVLFVAGSCSGGSLCYEVCDPCDECGTFVCNVDNAQCLRGEFVANLTLRYAIEVNHHAFHKYFARNCCIADTMWVLWFLKTFGARLGGTLYSFIANCVFSIASFQLMMCPCVQKRSKRGRKLGERTGHVVFGVVAVFLLWAALPLLFFGWNHDLVTLAVWYFVSAKLLSWFGASLFNFVTFVLLFHVQRPRREDESLTWLDPPLDPSAVDDRRNGLVKALNPRFHVLASEYARFVADSSGLDR